MRDMEIKTTKRKVGETIYGKTAKQDAEQRKHQMFEWNDRWDGGNHTLATPWATWTVEATNGGWAIYIEESE